MQPPTAPIVSCPTCGAPGVWHAQAGGWGCDRCRQMISTAPAPAAPAPAQTASAPASPPCPQCGTPAVFHAQLGRWGCDRCRAFLDTMPPPATPPVDPAKTARRAAAVKMIVLGLALCLLGIIITAATHESAKANGGGTYIIAYGPIVVGAVRMFQGLYYLA